MGVEVNIGEFEAAIMEAIQRRIQGAALKVAADVPEMIRDRASLLNLDVDDNEMPRKKPRPPSHPQNLPDQALFQTGDMLDNSGADRWEIKKLDDGAAVIYSPPDYFPYVIVARPWLLPDKINVTVRAKINERFATALKEFEE